MKRVLLAAAIGLMTFASCSEEAETTEEAAGPNIVGTWDVVMLGEDPIEDELLYVFNEDGTVDQNGRAGTWTMSEDGATVSISFEDGKTGEMTNVNVTDTQLTFEFAGDQLTLDKK